MRIMTVHLYLSLMPEALIASMLPPEEFGTYYSVGETKKQRGQAIFVELDPTFRHDFFRIEQGISRCIPHEDGAPKKSVYIATYRVLEHVPLSAMGKLYLVTSFGQTLGLERSNVLPTGDADFYMYQELTPVHPLVVSTYNPEAFYQFIIKDPESMIHLPAIAFVELQLGELAKNPEDGEVKDLPYSFIHHLREVLIDLKTKAITTKLVNRVQSVEFPFRMIKSGIFIGNTEELVYYPLPSKEKLRQDYYRWWRSANA